MPRSQGNTARALMVGVAACTLSVIVTGCAVGSNGASSAPISIQRGYIVDATTAWQKLNTVAYRGKQDDISFVDDKTGWYGNGAGKLYRTTDGGNSWQEQLSKPGTFVRTVGFVDAQRGFMGNVGTDYYPGVTDTNPLYETRDGGVTWSVVPQSRISGPLVKGLCAIDILKKQSIYQGVLQDRTIIHVRCARQ